jgi:hypothetical protein
MLLVPSIIKLHVPLKTEHFQNMNQITSQSCAYLSCCSDLLAADLRFEPRRSGLAGDAAAGGALLIPRQLGNGTAPASRGRGPAADAKRGGADPLMWRR